MIISPRANTTELITKGELKHECDFNQLWKSGKLSDVTLVVGSGCSFRVHKAILSARSPVFEAMFEHDMRENEENSVEITDVAAEVLEKLLGYIYTGKVPFELDRFAPELLMAADKVRTLIKD